MNDAWEFKGGRKGSHKLPLRGRHFIERGYGSVKITVGPDHPPIKLTAHRYRYMVEDTTDTSQTTARDALKEEPGCKRKRSPTLKGYKMDGSAELYHILGETNNETLAAQLLYQQNQQQLVGAAHAPLELSLDLVEYDEVHPASCSPLY